MTRSPKQKAWDQLWQTLQHDCVCYAAQDGSGEMRPKYHTMNYGQAVKDAVEKLQKTKLTVEQVTLVERLCHWVARAAFHA